MQAALKTLRSNLQIFLNLLPLTQRYFAYTAIISSLEKCLQVQLVGNTHKEKF